VMALSAIACQNPEMGNSDSLSVKIRVSMRFFKAITGDESFSGKHSLASEPSTIHAADCQLVEDGSEDE